MSSYEHNKAVRMKFDASKFGVEDMYDMEDKYPELFDFTKVGKFDTTATDEGYYIDYVLSHDHDDYGEYARCRMLSETEQEKYVKIFKQICNDVKGTDLRYVDYCWYNCSEPPDCFETSDDPFFDEI